MSLSVFTKLRDLMIQRLGVIYAAMALPIIVLNALLLPPMQGVDENSHFLRATQLSYGRIVGERQGDLEAGGRINQAAVTIARGFERMKFNPTTKLDRAQHDAARQLRWKDQPEVFAGFPNTVTYPPFFYLPSAATIWLGRVPNLRVIDTLVAARIANGIVCTLLGAIALAIAAQGRAILFAILSLPMTLDLFGAVSEAAIIPVFALVVAIFYLSSPDRRSGAARLAGSAALGAIAASKPPFVAFWLLLAGSSFIGSEAAWRARVQRFIASCVPALVVFGLWVGAGAVPLKVPFFPGGGVSPADQIQFLLHDPLAVIGVVRDIFGKFWRESFIGVLGWTGTRLPSPIYHCATLALLIALSLDLVQDEVMRPTAESILASLSMIGAIALTLVTLYIVAVKVGADYFDFQGRYSIPPALLLSIIVPNHVSKLGGGLRAIQAVGWAVLLASIWICELAVPMVLSSRYYWL